MGLGWFVVRSGLFGFDVVGFGLLGFLRGFVWCCGMPGFAVLGRLVDLVGAVFAVVFVSGWAGVVTSCVLALGECGL